MKLTRRLSLLVLLIVLACFALLRPPAAQAQTYPDVAKSYWAYGAIDWVTDQGPTGAKLLDDYAGRKFAPKALLTRQQLAAALVTASGHLTDPVADPAAIVDLASTSRYWQPVQVALALHLFSLSKGHFAPTARVPECQADRALVRMLQLMHPQADWTMLTALRNGTWQPNAGWKVAVPTRLPWEVAARYLGLRYNHLTQPALELSPSQDIDRAEAASMFEQALTTAPARLAGLAAFDQVELPPLSARQRQIVSFALRYVGYPYVWGGTWPTAVSPFGRQAHGGFDCSGFVWWVLKLNFGYAIPNGQRTAAAMAAHAKPRISLAKLKPCDIIFFAPKGPKSSASSVFHTGIYLGNGWFAESSSAFDGVTLGNLDWPGWYYGSDFAWGRRVLKAAQLAAGSAS